MIVKFWGSFGGVETFCINVMAAARAHSGHVYDIFVFDRIDKGGRARAPGNTRFYPGRWGLVAILWQLLQTPYDVVIINQPFSLLIVPFLRLRRRLRVAYVIHIDYGKAAKNALTRRLMLWLMNHCVDVILSMTTDNRQKIIHAGVRTPIQVFAPPMFAERSDLTRIDYATRPTDVIFFGRMWQQKDPLFFLEMVRRVHAERPDLSAVIIGSGPLDLAVDAYLAEHSMHYIARLPGMDQARLQDYVRDAKIFALTSEYEGLGLVMIEAMNWGAQVISVDIPVGPREFLAETGIIVERDVQVFADKVIETLRQLEAEPVRTRQAESRVLDRFRYETALPELEKAMIASRTG